MADSTDEAARLLGAVQGAPAATRAHLQAVSGFDADEAGLVREAAATWSSPVSALARRLLDDWATLSVTERTAGLLFLAEKLAACGTPAETS